MSLARVDRVAAAAARLPGYLRRTRWLELLAAISAEVQEIEDMWLAMLASNAIDDAGGDQLDQIGALVAMPRGGSSDVDYRRRIRAKVAVNRSLGLTNDILRLARLVVNDATVTMTLGQEGIASYVLSLAGSAVPTTTADDLAAFTRRATSAGVRGVIESSTVVDADAFALDGPGGLPFVTVPTLTLTTFTSSGFTTVVGIRPEWLDSSGGEPDGITLSLVDGALGIDDSGWPDIVVNAGVGADTIADVEHEIGSSAYLFVVSPSTVSGALAAGDEFGPVSVANVAGAPGGAFAVAQE